MFNRQAVSSLKTDKGDATRPRFLRRGGFSRGNAVTPSPAKSFISMIVLALTPSKKSSKSGQKSRTKKSANNHDSSHGSDTSNKPSTGSQKGPSSYAEALLRDDSETLTSTITPSSLPSPDSEIRISLPPAWKRPNVNNRVQFKSPLVPSQIALSSLFSPIRTVNHRSRLFNRQRSHSSLAGMTVDLNNVGGNSDFEEDSCHDVSAQDINQQFDIDSSQDAVYEYYDFDLNHDYDFDLDGDLATERHRYYLKGKNIHVDGVEMSAEEEEFTKSFNRIKLDKRHRRKHLHSDDVEDI